jgi:hypothetical protein
VWSQRRSCRVRVGVVLVLALAFAGCGSSRDGGVTVYLQQRLGPDGPPGQIAPVLEPTERPRREGLSAGVQALVQLSQGPTPSERVRGFEPTVAPGTRLRLERVAHGTAFVEVVGGELDFEGVAAVVYSLTALPDVQRVRVCCLYRHDGSKVFVHERANFRGWRGEPCEERTDPTSVRCLRDR